MEPHKKLFIIQKFLFKNDNFEEVNQKSYLFWTELVFNKKIGSSKDTDKKSLIL